MWRNVRCAQTRNLFPCNARWTSPKPGSLISQQDGQLLGRPAQAPQDVIHNDIIILNVVFCNDNIWFVAKPSALPILPEGANARAFDHHIPNIAAEVFVIQPHEQKGPQFAGITPFGGQFLA